MFETQIAKGVALLNEKMPGWHTRVNVQKLNIASCTRCVLGQLFVWPRCIDRELMSTDWPAHRFTVPAHLDEGADHNERASAFGQLTREWRWVIARAQGYRL